MKMISYSRVCLVESKSNSLEVSWEVDSRINHTHLVLELSLPSRTLCVFEISRRARSYLIENLVPNTTYILRIKPVREKKEFSWSYPFVFMTEKEQEPGLVALEKKIVESSGESVQVKQARKSRDWLDFISCSYKYSRPPSNRDLRLKRTMLWCNAIDAIEESGFSTGDNWFMGPMYKGFK